MDGDLATANYLPISRINQFLYCPRRFWLVFQEDSMYVSAEVLEGVLQHDIVHETSHRGSQFTAVPVVSHRLQILGIIDVVEHNANDVWTVIEYKRGSTQDWENDQLQVAALAIALEETANIHVSMGGIFSWSNRHRRLFPLDSSMRDTVETSLDQMRTILTHAVRPEPTSERYKCERCSVKEICQPSLIRKMNSSVTRQGKRGSSE